MLVGYVLCEDLLPGLLEERGVEGVTHDHVTSGSRCGGESERIDTKNNLS